MGIFTPIRRRPAAVSTPVLVLFPIRCLYHDPAGDGQLPHLRRRASQRVLDSAPMWKLRPGVRLRDRTASPTSPSQRGIECAATRSADDVRRADPPRRRSDRGRHRGRDGPSRSSSSTSSPVPRPMQGPRRPPSSPRRCEESLRAPAELASSLGIETEPLRVLSPRPIDALVDSAASDGRACWSWVGPERLGRRFVAAASASGPRPRPGRRPRSLSNPRVSASAMRSPIMMLGRFVFARGICGINEASATTTPSTPLSLPAASQTDCGP